MSQINLKQMIVKQINDAYIAAVKAKDEVRRDTLKLVKSAFMVLDKAPGKAPSEADYMNAVVKMAKTLRENSELYPAMAIDNQIELDVINEFIPKQLDIAAVQALIDILRAEGVAFTQKMMGTIVKTIVERSNGATDGKTVSTLLKGQLS